MNEVEKDIQRVLELVTIDKKPSSSVKRKVLEQPKSRKLWWNLELPMVAVLSLILVVSTGIILHLKNTPEAEINPLKIAAGILPQTQLPVSKGPAPMPFTHPIEIVAESYPVHPNQTFTIQPKDKSWNGKEVKLYCIEETQSNDQEVLYHKVLPPNALYIGSTVIDQEKWSFQWKAPVEVGPKGDNGFLVVVQSDEGTLSAVRLATFSYDKLEITPSTVKVGQKIELRGAGFPVGDIRVDLIKEENGSTEFQTNIGSLHSYDGTFNYSFTPKINGNQITPGTYQVLIVFPIPGTAREAVRVNLKVE